MKKRKNIIIAVFLILAVGLIGGLGMNMKKHSVQQSSISQDSVVATNGLSLNTNSIKLTDYLGKNSTNDLATVKIGVENEGSSAKPIGAIDFEAKLSNGKTINPDPNYSGFYLNSESGTKKDVNLFFKVPKDQKITKLIYHINAKDEVTLKVK